MMQNLRDAIGKVWPLGLALLIGTIVWFVYVSLFKNDGGKNSSGETDFADAPIRVSEIGASAHRDSPKENAESWLVKKENSAKSTYDLFYSQRTEEETLLSNSNTINAEVAKEIGLSAKEVKQLSGQISELWSTMGDLTKRYTEIDQLRSDSAKKVSAFRVAIPKQEGRMILNRFEQEIRATYDASKARGILSRFNWANFFGAFGHLETLVQFQEYPAYPESPIMARYEMRDPQTGEMIAAGSCAYEEFQDRFGDIFLIESQ